MFVRSEFDVIEVQEVGASRPKPIVKTNCLPDGTHGGQVFDNALARNDGAVVYNLS